VDAGQGLLCGRLLSKRICRKISRFEVSLCLVKHQAGTPWTRVLNEAQLQRTGDRKMEGFESDAHRAFSRIQSLLDLPDSHVSFSCISFHIVLSA
jgi:hypothetical protein